MARFLPGFPITKLNLILNKIKSKVTEFYKKTYCFLDLFRIRN